jgi:hypothetical protein
MNTEKQPLWKIASFPFNTGIYNGLDYISKGYYKHVMENFGRYEEHKTADLNSYEFRTGPLEMVEERHKSNLKRAEKLDDQRRRLISEIPEKEKNKLTRVNFPQIDWIMRTQPTNPVVNKHWCDGKEYMSFSLVDYQQARTNRKVVYEILTEVYEALPQEFKNLETGKRIKLNRDNTNWLKAVKKHEMVEYFLNGQEVSSKGRFISDDLDTNTIEMDVEKYYQFPEEFREPFRSFPKSYTSSKNAELETAYKTINRLTNELSEKDEEVEKLRNKLNLVVSIIEDKPEDSSF